jgi:chromosome segregation ATPase
MLRLKYDNARNQKDKSKEEYKRLESKLKDLKSESKSISDDNNPYMRRIKMLENKLDKAMIKYNEAQSIRRTYEQILARLREERAGYDNQISAIQKSLKAKAHDCEEFKLLLQDAKQSRAYSELLLKNTELSVHNIINII